MAPGALFSTGIFERAEVGVQRARAVRLQPGPLASTPFNTLGGCGHSYKTKNVCGRGSVGVVGH